MASTEQLEREAELTRAQLAASLDELRSVTPGRVIDEILGYAKSGSAELLRGIGNQVVEHPLPATLIGAGLAWLIMSNNNANGPSRGTMYPERTRDTSAGSWFSETGRSASVTAEGMRDRAGSVMHDMKESAQSAMANMGERLDNTTDMMKQRAQSIGDSLSGAYGTVADTVNSTATSIADAAASITPSQDELLQAGQRIWDYCKEQPLVVAGLGIALGAALGAAIPQTAAENRLMGEAADSLKDKAQRLVSDPLKSANDAAKSVGEQIVDEAAKIAKKGVANLVDSWGSSGGIQSDQQSGGQTAGEESFPSSGSDRPFH
jgi:ElaB/YqjD/DUF883 family membrane-anchored ribosome-binding protein